jgi:hypothetical protein
MPADSAQIWKWSITVKKILGLSALALFLGVVGATATPLITHACQIYSCPVNGG